MTKIQPHRKVNLNTAYCNADIGGRYFKAWDSQ